MGKRKSAKPASPWAVRQVRKAFEAFIEQNSDVPTVPNLLVLITSGTGSKMVHSIYANDSWHVEDAAAVMRLILLGKTNWIESREGGGVRTDGMAAAFQTIAAYVAQQRRHDSRFQNLHMAVANPEGAIIHSHGGRELIQEVLHFEEYMDAGPGVEEHAPDRAHVDRCS